MPAHSRLKEACFRTPTSRASTTFLHRDADGRDKPGHEFRGNSIPKWFTPLRVCVPTPALQDAP